MVVSPVRPVFRGRLHQLAFVGSVPAGVLLLRAAHDRNARIAAAVFSGALFALYGTSAAYHRVTWKNPQARLRMRRADHSTIFLLIAGTYTAVSLLTLDPAWQRALLAVVWVGALTGIALKTFSLDKTRKLTAAMYIVLGWAAVAAFPQFISRMPAGALALIVAGGVLYTIGAIIFARRRPNPSPRVFGYHELWHTMVVAASACHYAAIRLLLASR